MSWGLSWEKARAEAGRLVDRMQFRNADLAGKSIEVAPIMAPCKQEGKFREMIEQAVVRILRSRGAFGVTSPSSLSKEEGFL